MQDFSRSLAFLTLNTWRSARTVSVKPGVPVVIQPFSMTRLARLIGCCLRRKCLGSIQNDKGSTGVEVTTARQ